MTISKDQAEAHILDMRTENPKTAHDVSFNWYVVCSTLAETYPMGSLGNCFWWSLRFEFDQGESRKMWAEEPEKALNEWLEYLAYKYDQGEKFRSVA